jgi:putative DNA primase/helicase
MSAAESHIPGKSFQGGALNLGKVALWPDPVKGAEVLSQIAEDYSRYVVLPPGAAEALALWTAHAHCYELFQCSPRLNISSPEKRCGKTTLRDIVAVLVPRPLPTENLSTAVLFRVVHAHAPTVLADEYDSWLRDNEELRGMLNAGHRRGGQALRCEGKSFEPRAFNVFAPAVLCGIGTLPDTLHDRSIVIRLERAKPGELRERFDSRHTKHEHELCQELARFVADNRERIELCDPKLPDAAFNRLADNWRPLFAIAEIAGDDWPKRAAAAFAKLTSHEDLDAQSITVALLADIADIFTSSSANKLPSIEITDALTNMEGREWAEWGRARKPITPNQLATLLRRFKISPRTIKLADASTAKGYHRAMFDEAFARYLPQPPVPKRHPVTLSENVEDSAISVTSPANGGLRIESGEIAIKDTEGDAVTLQTAWEIGSDALLL